MIADRLRATPADALFDRLKRSLDREPVVNTRPRPLDLGGTASGPGDYPRVFLGVTADARDARALILSEPCVIRGRVIAVHRDHGMPDFAVNVGLALSGLCSLPVLWRLAEPKQAYFDQGDGLTARALTWSIPAGLLGGFVRRSGFLHVHLFDDWKCRTQALDTLRVGERVEIECAIAALVAVDVDGGHDVLFQETDDCWCAYPLRIKSDHD